MHFPKLLGIASGLALSSSLAFAWSIDGVVKSKVSGRLLSGVKISTFNIAGYETTSGTDGTFSLNGGTDALPGMKVANMAIHMEGGMLTIYNADANNLKVSVIDALGKVLAQSNPGHVQGIVTLNFGKLARGAKFIRVNADSDKATYMVTNKGVKALKKEGDLLPMLQFAMDGYANLVYQMKDEIETGVTIEMVRPSSSSSGGNDPVVTSSSDTPVVSSSSKTPIDTPVDCSGKTMKASTSITVDGRKIDIKFPSGYKGDKLVPLLVYYHPIGGSSGNADGSSTVKAALADGAIVAAPNGGKTPAGGMMGSVQAWNVGPCCTDEDDVTFSKHFIAEIQEKACVDPKRIYASGFSMGGGMSNYAGCFMADIYAAAAPSAFDLAKEIVDAGKCKPARPFPILNFRGTSDNIVMYDGGLSQVVQGKPITFMGAVNNMKEWAKMNGCSGSPKQNTPGNGCQMYEDCEGGVKVGLCTIQGGSHAEGDGQTGWNFLKQFTLP
ncbi:polyhydroxybutyrate depolymerase [Fibrobacter sp. UWT3]|uniref:feruloyl esterase n=1 Tax=Fibrobacter sp. UWT3 TaxID=1896225 RepID=UPI000BC68039|nr:feruloyl esterase [Fibrobacter sp. UWT3]SOE52868.1 polyhydroxybutyrate depolymerase [Fibrobacter sp. UWT3]